MTAWKANQPVVLGGSLFFLDVVFRGVKLEKYWLGEFVGVRGALALPE